jgi:hypothetical protein
VLPAQAVSDVGSIFRTLVSSRESATKALEGFFRLSQMTGILNGLTIGVGVEVSQSNIQPNGFTCWFSFFNPFNIQTKLSIVSISATNNSNSLNLTQLVEVQVTGSPQLEASCFETIGESDSSPIFRQLVACGLVFHRSMCLMFLEAWKTSSTLLALLRGFDVSAQPNVVVEPCNGRPCPFSRRLTGHRIELVRPRELLGKNSTISTQFILPDPAVIHPVSDARVSDKTGSTNSFIKLLVLLVASLKFCLKYKHGYADTSSIILTQNEKLSWKVTELVEVRTGL